MERNEIIRKHPQINPCDFGVPEIYREMAENYATWRVSKEREACLWDCGKFILASEAAIEIETRSKK